MFWKGVVMAVFVVSAVAMSVTDAHAQFAGWGWFGFSEVTGSIDTVKTPNPKGKPSSIQVTVSATIQIACKNPADNGVFNGKSFKTTLSTSSVVGPDSPILDVKSGNATTLVTLPLNQFELAENCTNPNWIPVTDSAMTLSFDGVVTWCLTEGGVLQCGGKGTLDSNTVSCVLNTTLYPRQADGTAPHPAILDCPQPTS